jgi:large subunit ribosomal protein L14e
LNQVIVENPSDSPDQAVPRHSAPLKHLALTSLEIEKLPRAIGHTPLKKKWAAAEIDKKWEKHAFSQSRDKSSKRRKLNDFERFKSMRLRKQVRKQ